MSSGFSKPQSGVMKDQRPNGALVNPVFDPDAT